MTEMYARDVEHRALGDTVNGGVARLAPVLRDKRLLRGRPRREVLGRVQRSGVGEAELHDGGLQAGFAEVAHERVLHDRLVLLDHTRELQ